ncbi:hypothetical protein JHK85_010103 [Glycine max]|nr:hypothetical protein JHK85_010103 [Glycine max]KAG5066118.1 hypothetical protein JHK86_009849 [Glycine max]
MESEDRTWLFITSDGGPESFIFGVVTVVPHNIQPTTRAIIQEWEKPSSDFLKLNIDAALFTDQHSFGLGLCIRDHSGGFVRARSFLLQGNPDPREAEVLGLLYALQWVSDFRVDKIIFELDSKIGVNEFNKHLLGNSEFHAIISRCVIEWTS